MFLYLQLFNQPNCPFPKLRGISFSCVHYSILSKNRVFGKAGAVQFDVFASDSENKNIYAQLLNEQLGALDDLKGERLALCTANFNQSAESLVGQLGVIIFQYAYSTDAGH